MSGIPDLADYPLNHEVLGAIVYFTNIGNTSNININIKFYNNNTNKLLWEGYQYIPTPASQGREWWNWYKTKFWIGHASWEIDSPMTVRMEITLSGWMSESRTLYMDVVDTTPPIRIKETITWQAFVPNMENDFIVYSIYGIDVDGTPKGFIQETWTGKLVRTSSMIRQDNIIMPIPSQVDCLTLINDFTTGKNYDWKIDKNVI